ncbi:MAG: P-loop NTPase [Deltaproteobacteria bacterium]|jgi:flagellar biosynthesis protein FlhG|nr:P-loop NTPase [Deltaproteobacteria bacterium]
MDKKNIWAIGGGKGGVGKSFVAGNLGILLAQSGYKVILADLDLGGANLHTWLGVNSPSKSLSDFIGRETLNISKLLIPTEIPGLSLISGAKDGVEIANLKYTQKRRFLSALRNLDADYIVIDLGAGTSYNTVDFFLLADSQLMVVIPEPTSIENAYRFIKNSFFRQIFHNSKNFGLKSVLTPILRKDNPYKVNTPKELIDYLNKLGGSSTVFIEEQLQIFLPKIILNQVRTERDQQVGPAMKAACSKYFNLNMSFLGYISEDESVWKSVLDRKPLAVAYPDGVPMQQLKSICSDILLEETELAAKNNLLSQLAL